MTAPLPLSRVPQGGRCRVLGIEGAHGHELVREGLLPGAELVVTTRTPLGGPLVVELGRVRLALSADLAGQVMTDLVDPAEPR